MERIWEWHPLGNEELWVAGGCSALPSGKRCGALVAREVDGAWLPLAWVSSERWQPTLRAFDLDELLRDRGGGDLERGLSTPMGSLSGGEQRRVLLARVFSSGADVLLLDEPEVGLDSDRRTELRSILEAEAVRRIVVLVAHDPGIVPSSFERIALSGGQEPHPSA